jgi:hypothetical protein
MTGMAGASILFRGCGLLPDPHGWLQRTAM